MPTTTLRPPPLHPPGLDDTFETDPVSSSCRRAAGRAYVALAPDVGIAMAFPSVLSIPYALEGAEAILAKVLGA